MESISKLYQEMERKTEEKRKYIKPLENLLNFFIKNKIKIKYKYDHDLFNVLRSNGEEKVVSYTFTVNEIFTDVFIIFKKKFCGDNEFEVRISLNFEKEYIYFSNENLEFYEYLSKYGKDFDLLIDGWKIGKEGKKCI